MFADQMLELFAKESPVSVMVRATLEHALGDDRLNAIFEEQAERQYCRELTFAGCVALMTLVVARIRPSIHAAYQARAEDFAVTVQSVYNKLQGIEPAVTEALVRETAADFRKVIDELDGAVDGPLAGFDVRIIDGNHLAGTEHRIQELRRLGAAALPGQSVPVLDPQRQLIEDVVLCEDGHAHERVLLDQLLKKVAAGQCWIADRAYSTKLFLFGIADRKAYFVIRQHASLTGELLGQRRKIGHTETGVVYEQEIKITYEAGATKTFRRVTIERDQRTRKGETAVHILTNLPQRVTALRVAAAYRSRWTIESAFQEVTVHLRCELNTLGYPDAALFGFGIALLIHNALSVIQAALRGSQTNRRKIERNLSLYALADEVSGVWRGLEIAVPQAIWTKNFARLTTKQLAGQLRLLARKVDLKKFTTYKWSPKTKQPKRQSGNRGNHVATQRLLAKRT